MEVFLDDRGRITLPKKVRELTGIKPGVGVELDVEGKSILLKPKPQKINKVKSNRFWDAKTFLDAEESTFGR